MLANEHVDAAGAGGKASTSERSARSAASGSPLAELGNEHRVALAGRRDRLPARVQRASDRVPRPPWCRRGGLTAGQRPRAVPGRERTGGPGGDPRTWNLPTRVPGVRFLG